MAKRAFLIGANTLGLQYAQYDVSLMQECLTGYNYTIYVPDTTDKWDIHKQFGQWAENCNKADTCIFYFSGHGILIKGKLHLVLDDSSTNNCNIDYITIPFAECKASAKLIILDCCHAGATHADLRLDSTDIYRLLTASERLERSKELDRLQASFLTYYIHRALTHYACEIVDQDKIIRLNKLYEWLKFQAQQHNAKPHVPQIPIPNLLGNDKANIEIAVVKDIPKEQAVRIDEIGRELKDPKHRIPVKILHSACKNVNREQIKAVGHDKYLPDIYIERKAELEVEKFVQFEKTFLKRAAEILNKLDKIAQIDHLGEASILYLSNAKLEVQNIQDKEQYFTFVKKLKRVFFYEEIEDVVKSIYVTIPELDNNKFNSNVRKIISRLKNFPFVKQEDLQAIPNLLLEASREAKIQHRSLTQNDGIVKTILQIFPSQRKYHGKFVVSIKLANDFIREIEHLIGLHTQRCVVEGQIYSPPQVQIYSSLFLG